MNYDPDIAPDAQAWLALPESERISVGLRHHKGRYPDALHVADTNEIMHAALHQLIETQLAQNSPASTGRALARLQAAGLRRHAAVHLLMREMAAQLGSLIDGKVFDAEAWDLTMDRLSATSKPPRRPPERKLNRAERRRQKRKT